MWAFKIHEVDTCSNIWCCWLWISIKIHAKDSWVVVALVLWMWQAKSSEWCSFIDNIGIYRFQLCIFNPYQGIDPTFQPFIWIQINVSSLLSLHARCREWETFIEVKYEQHCVTFKLTMICLQQMWISFFLMHPITSQSSVLSLLIHSLHLQQRSC